ncbi:FAST kinase domain-containing protein 5, mitochondrial [Candoia aspera]|uniref:FAST kinase domain-containing protein 5, mitochondrial n=1 Tax=Candoia aspera TaxID=51853 RepID=UPI002FD843EF
MSTGIICRRFSGRSCRTAAFSTATKAETTKIFPKGEEGHGTKRGGRDSKPAVALKPWKPPGYWLNYYPSASLETKCLLHKGASQGVTEGSLEYVCSRTSIKRIQNIHSVTRPSRLPRIKNMLLDLENSKAFCTQASLREPLVQSPIKNDRDEVHLEAYGGKEVARQFQKQRPEYKSLCYNHGKCLQPLSVEECHLILQKVSVLKERMKPEALADAFFRLSHLPAEKHQAIKSSAKFAVLCRSVVSSIQLFETPELIVLLNAFVSLGIPPIHRMLKVVETECCRRVGHLSLDQQLLVADLWRCLNCKVPQYLDAVLNYINASWKDLSLPQLVQLVYIVGEGRKAPEELIKKLEASVVKHLDSLSLEEVGIICLGFFKSQSHMSEPLMRKIGDKICGRLGDMSSFAIVNVLKMFRGVHVDHVDFLKQLGHVLPPRVSTISIQGVMHVAFACSSLHYCDENIMNAVAAAVPPKAASCRTKDIAKLLWSFGNLNYEPPNAEEFYASLGEQLESRLFEYNKFPEHLITSLIGLAFVQRFPYDLLDYALSPEFIKLSGVSKYDLSKDFFTLNGAVEIECPRYTGSRLTTQNKQEMAEKMQNYVVKQEFAVAWSLLEDMLGGSQFVKLHAVLPHVRSVDLEIRLDSNQKPLPFNSKGATTGHPELKKNGMFLTDKIIHQLLKGKSVSQPIPGDRKSKQDMHSQKRADSHELPVWNSWEFSDGILLAGPSLNTLVDTQAEGLPSVINQEQQKCVKLALQVTNRNQYRYHSRELLGLHSMKRRQLRQIGYIPVELPFWEWFPLLKCSREEQLMYLCQKVYER